MTTEITQHLINDEGFLVRETIQRKVLGPAATVLSPVLPATILYSVWLAEDLLLCLSETKTFVVFSIPSFEFSCEFMPVKIGEEAFIVPCKNRNSLSTKMLLTWKPPEWARCVVVNRYDRLKNFHDDSSIYLLSDKEIFVPQITNVYSSGRICFGHGRKPIQYPGANHNYADEIREILSTTPWNNDLFPSSNRNLEENRWDAEGQKLSWQKPTFCDSENVPVFEKACLNLFAEGGLWI